MPDGARAKLVSWKEVAAYVGCDIRTVQRWERELGLPVHRPPGTKGHRVFAFPAEIDAWLTREGGRAEGNQAADSQAGQDASSPTAIAAIVTAPVNTQSISVPRRHAVSKWVAAAVGVLGATLVGAIIWVWQDHRPVEVGEVTFEGEQLLAWSNGKPVWTYDFDRPLRDRNASDPEPLIANLNGDGSKEIIAAVPTLVFDRAGVSTDVLYCFSSRGRVLWRQVFDNRVRFGGEDCGPRWEVRALMLTSHGSTRNVWCTICSYPTSVAVLLKIDAGGHATPFFVNYGHLNVLGEVRAPDASYVLAGGINNEYNCAMLAVLREGDASGRSPQTAAFSRCDGCPEGEPYRYLLFPNSEVSLAAGKPYNEVSEILVTGTHVQAMTSEIPNGLTPADWGLYDLGNDYTPRTRFFSDNYWADHRKFTAESAINHPLELCPERLAPSTVRVWHPEGGWKEVKLPPIASKPGARDIGSAARSFQ